MQGRGFRAVVLLVLGVIFWGWLAIGGEDAASDDLDAGAPPVTERQ